MDSSHDIVSTPEPTPLLVAEYNYIAQSAFQANEDRARVSQFFFVTVGTLVAAIFSSQIDIVDPSGLYYTFAVIFILLAAFGALTLYHLTRLRLAWLECALAMNQIKDQAIKQMPDLAAYYRWNSGTVPPAFKARSVGFLLAVMVSLLSGLALGAAAAFLGLAGRQGAIPWLSSIGAGLAGAGILLVVFYYLPLREKLTGTPEAESRSG
jgi:hypothetical protein